MRDYLKRLLIAGLMALCVSLLFLGGKHSQAATFDISEATKDWVWPANGTITDLYGTRNGQHKGIDIAAGYGAPIHAVDDGEVTKSYYSTSYGNVIFIKHKNHTETVYAHLKSRLVEEGKKVNQGELIGEMGNTGDSSGVHLHFEVHKNKWTFDKKNAMDPVFALGGGKIGQTVYALHKRALKEEVIEAAAQLRLSNERVENKEHKAIEKKKSDSENHFHIVKQGETLWSIAKSYGTTVEMIKSMNNLEADEIKANQKLMVREQNKRYIVKQGDTLTMIAKKANTSVQKIKALNQRTNDIIRPKEMIKLP